MTNDSNTSRRDELALDIFLADNGSIPEGVLRQDWADAPDRHHPYAHNIADGLIAKGYTKPRTITTVEDLETLPAGTVIRTRNGEVFERQASGPYHDGPHDWQGIEGTFWNGETFTFPATVLHLPEAAA